jgi:hypothetical protein
MECTRQAAGGSSPHEGEHSEYAAKIQEEGGEFLHLFLFLDRFDAVELS